MNLSSIIPAKIVDAYLDGLGSMIPLTRELYNQRMKICFGCDQYDLINHQCIKCNSDVDVRNVWTKTECPLGKFKSFKAVVTFEEAKDEPLPEPPLPSIPKQIINITSDAMDSIGHLLRTGKIKRTPDEQARVHAICKRNQCGMYRASDDRCAHPDCGCHLAIKSGALALHCGAGLW